jgi:small nuclear ribonucleoprotein G
MNRYSFNPYQRQQRDQVRHRPHAPNGTQKQKILPPLYDYLDKHVFVELKNGGGKVSGILTGFDVFQNLAIGDSLDESRVGVKTQMGEIVR